MTYKRTLRLFVCAIALAAIAFPALAQGERGHATLKAGSGNITVDYGRPSLQGPAVQGRDPLTVLNPGSYWRMGKDEATTLNTPVDLMFDTSKVAKGNYTLRLFKASADAYELAFTPQGGQGTDSAKEAIKVAMKKVTAPKSVEIFTIELKDAPNGGTFILTWGTAQLTADFQIGK
jgi:hypothetical protein